MSKYHFFVYCPDKTEEGTLQRRLAARPTHLGNAKTAIESGFIRVGGVLATPETFLDEAKHMVGSTFVCLAESVDVVRKFIESDIYYTSGVWDPAKIVILPYLAATPIP